MVVLMKRVRIQSRSKSNLIGRVKKPFFAATVDEPVRYLGWFKGEKVFQSKVNNKPVKDHYYTKRYWSLTFKLSKRELSKISKAK